MNVLFCYSLSKVTNPKPLKTSWEKKMKERAEKKSVKECERSLKSDIKKKLEVLRYHDNYYGII